MSNKGAVTAGLEKGVVGIGLVTFLVYDILCGVGLCSLRRGEGSWSRAWSSYVSRISVEFSVEILSRAVC
jgi:hypothetical protein